eukprot:6057316-Amphidinium_carterae.1
MKKLMKRAGCLQHDIKRAYDSYHEGPHGQQPIPRQTTRKGKGDADKKDTLSVFDDSSLNASTRVSYKKQEQRTRKYDDASEKNDQTTTINNKPIYIKGYNTTCYTADRTRDDHKLLRKCSATTYCDRRAQRHKHKT